WVQFSYLIVLVNFKDTRLAAFSWMLKLMAISRLLTKILSDFLSGFYLLNYVLKHATNLIQQRYVAFDEPANYETFINNFLTCNNFKLFEFERKY
ncbi:MAG: hypothetical protein ACSHXF_07050, partial [Aquaticitalea sp.]